MSTHRGLRAVALTTAVVVAFGGCGGIKARKDRADRIIHSVDKAIGAGSAQMAVSTKAVVKLDRTDRLVAGGARAAAIPATSLAAQADLAHGRVAYITPNRDGAPEAVRIYAGTTIYARRISPAAKAERPWVRLNLTSVDPDQIDNQDIQVADAVRRLREAQGFDNPLFLLSLLRGTLSGSVDRIGAEPIRGVPTTHYKLNIDREKAVKHYPQRVQDAYEAVFKSLFATRTVFPGEVWLDRDGRPRQYSVTLKSRVRRTALVDFHLTVELFDLGQPVQIVLPTKRETVVVDGLGGLARAVSGGAQ